MLQNVLCGHGLRKKWFSRDICWTFKNTEREKKTHRKKSREATPQSSFVKDFTHRCQTYDLFNLFWREKNCFVFTALQKTLLFYFTDPRCSVKSTMFSDPTKCSTLCGFILIIEQHKNILVQKKKDVTTLCNQHIFSFLYYIFVSFIASTFHPSN